MDKLEELRSELNSIDAWIVEALGQRFEICRAVARHKREHGIAMMQPARIAEVTERSAALARRHGMDAAFARRLFAMIIAEACRQEDDIIGHEDAVSNLPR